MKLQKTVWALAIALVLCVTAVRAQDQKARSAVRHSFFSDSSAGFRWKQRLRQAACSGRARRFFSHTMPSHTIRRRSNRIPIRFPALNFSAWVRCNTARNIFDPALSFSALGQSWPTGTAGQSTLQAETIFGGSLNFNRIWSRYHFTAIYNGGENLYSMQGPDT